MKYPLTMSIIVVQMDDESTASAQVCYEDRGGKGERVTVDLRLGTIPDAVDMQMWAQMVAASVCDAL